MLHHVTFLAVVLSCLAVARLAVLVTRDTITKPIRDAVDHRWQGTLVELLHCTWCVSIWIAAAVGLLTYFCWDWWQWVALGLAASEVAGFLGEHS